MGEHTCGGERATVSVDEHVARILGAVQPLPPVSVPMSEALGLTLAADVVSPSSLPPFDNSAMDGYAVHWRDVATASDEFPVHLPVTGGGGGAAGDAPGGELAPGTAAKIMTGAPVPPGATAVVPYEWTDRGTVEVVINRPAGEGANIRTAGEDVLTGDLLAEAGTVLGPRHIALLAAVGLPRVQARPKPRIAVVSTGSELRPLGERLAPGTIYDSNSYMLAAAARAAGAAAYRVSVPDDPERLLETLQDQVSRADIVVTSGGVSQGDFDVVKAALSATGEVWFGDVAMQPGKPQGFGTIRAGSASAPIFTLPGNPVSAYLSFQLFVLPALRMMQGHPRRSMTERSARCTHGFRSPAGRRQFVRGAYDASNPDLVAPVGGHGSHLLGDLAASNALIVVPEDVTEVAAGDTVRIMLLDEDF